MKKVALSLVTLLAVAMIISCSPVDIKTLTPEQRIYEVGGKQLERAVVVYEEYLNEIVNQESKGDIPTEEVDAIIATAYKVEASLLAFQDGIVIAINVATTEDKLQEALAALQPALQNVIRVSSAFSNDGDLLFKHIVGDDNPDILIDLAGFGSRIAVKLLTLNGSRPPIQDMTKEDVINTIEAVVIKSPSSLRPVGE